MSDEPRVLRLAAVWVDDEGVVHTVALPRPAELMSTEFRRGLDRLVADHRTALVNILEGAQARLLESDWSHLASTEAYVLAAPPRALLRGSVATTEGVRVAVEGIEDRWRLDVVMALEDYID